MIHGSDNGPACGFYPGSKPSCAGEEIDGERTACPARSVVMLVEEFERDAV